MHKLWMLCNFTNHSSLPASMVTNDRWCRHVKYHLWITINCFNFFKVPEHRWFWFFIFSQLLILWNILDSLYPMWNEGVKPAMIIRNKVYLLWLLWFLFIKVVSVLSNYFCMINQLNNSICLLLILSYPSQSIIWQDIAKKTRQRKVTLGWVLPVDYSQAMLQCSICWHSLIRALKYDEGNK